MALNHSFPSFRFFCVFVGISFFSFHSSVSAQNQKKPKDPLAPLFASFEKRIRYISLANGMKVILLKRGFAPTVACYIKYKAGSYDEKPGDFGIAHMLEHMLFKGTKKVGTYDFQAERKYLRLTIRYANYLDRWRKKYEKAIKAGDKIKTSQAKEELTKWKKRLAHISQQSKAYIHTEPYSQIYARQGAKGYNAYTSSDLTNYQIQLPNNRLEVWALLEADRMQNAVFRDFYTERLVVQEERRMRVDNSPRSKLWERFRSEIYGSHPYGHPIIGPMTSIRFLSHKQAVDFYHSYYAPNNTVISLVGNINLEKTEKIIRKYFSPLKHRSLAKTPQTDPPVPRSLNVKMSGGSVPLLYTAWLKPAAPDPNDLYLEALSGILARGRESRLYTRLVLEDKKAVQVSSYNGAVGRRGDNLFIIHALPSPGVSLKELKKIILQEIRKIRLEGVSQKEINRFQSATQLYLSESFQSNSFLADSLSRFEILTDDYRNLFRFNKLIGEMKPSDIQRAAVRFLRPEYLMTAQLIPDKNQKKKKLPISPPSRLEK